MDTHLSKKKALLSNIKSLLSIAAFHNCFFTAHQLQLIFKNCSSNKQTPSGESCNKLKQQLVKLQKKSSK
jgi:hypothetical protein